MPEPEDDLVEWRLRVIEEAIKYQAAQIEQLERRPRTRKGDFPSKLELERDYVKKSDLDKKRDSSTQVWGLRLVAAGILLSNLIALISLIHTLAHG